jgi:glycosyltransferase involved in cell wall biosynthesis
MNYDLPIITTDRVGAGFDLVKHEKNGYIYPVNKTLYLEKYLAALLKNTGLRRKMGTESKSIINKWN